MIKSTHYPANKKPRYLAGVGGGVAANQEKSRAGSKSTRVSRLSLNIFFSQRVLTKLGRDAH